VIEDIEVVRSWQAVWRQKGEVRILDVNFSGVLAEF
jgi:hypothetical protein